MPIGPRGDAGVVLEELAEGGQVGKSVVHGDLLDGSVREAELVGDGVQRIFVQPREGGLSARLLDGGGEVLRGDAQLAGIIGHAPPLSFGDGDHLQEAAEDEVFLLELGASAIFHVALDDDAHLVEGGGHQRLHDLLVVIVPQAAELFLEEVEDVACDGHLGGVHVEHGVLHGVHHHGPEAATGSADGLLELGVRHAEEEAVEVFRVEEALHRRARRADKNVAGADFNGSSAEVQMQVAGHDDHGEDHSLAFSLGVLEGFQAVHDNHVAVGIIDLRLLHTLQK